MGSGSSTANQQFNQQLSQASNGNLTPVTSQNAQSVMQGDIAQARQGNPMGLYNFPLETLVGIGQSNQNDFSNMPVAGSGFSYANDQSTSAPQPSQQPVSSGDGIPSPQTNVQPFFTSPSSVQGLDINQFVNPDGTAAPLGAQPNFVNQNQPPPWTPAKNDFNGTINGIPYDNSQPGMLGTPPPPGGGIARGSGTGAGTGGGNRAMMGT